MTQKKIPLDPWLDLADEILKFISNPPMAGAQFRAPASHLNAGRLLVFQWGRGVRSFKAILTLVREGYSEDAIILVRTLLEGLFEMSFIAKHPEAADLYISHGLRALAADCKWMRENNDPPPDIKASLALQEAKALVQDPSGTMQAKRSLRSRWHPQFPTIRSRAIEAGIDPIYHNVLYAFTSRYVHGSGDWLADYFSPWRPSSRISYGAASGESPLAVMSACRSVIEELRILNECLSMSLGDSLISLQNSAQHVYDNFGSTTLEEYGLHEPSSDVQQENE